MKRIMSLMLGLSLLTGSAMFAADAKDTGKKTKTTKTKSTSSKGKKKATTTSTAPAPSK